MSADPLVSRMARLEGAFDQIGERLNSIDRRLDAVGRRFDQLDGKLEARFGQVDGRINSQTAIMVSMWVTTMLGALGLYFRH